MAVDRLFESLRPELLRFAWWLARDRAVAEDVVQEALLRAGVPGMRCRIRRRPGAGC